MLTIGITGSFGTGKTTVAGMFKELGAYILDADRIAHQLLERGTIEYKAIAEEFGRGILDEHEDIDRANLAEIVFSDEKRLVSLCRIIHPVVIERIRRERDSIAVRNPGAVLAIDAPLLIEAGVVDLADRLVVVYADLEKRIERLSGIFSEEAIKKRIAMQMSLEEKLKQADFAIDNNGTQEETRVQVEGVWNCIAADV